jgi:hypothetical protein
VSAEKRRNVNGGRPRVDLTDREQECLNAVRQNVEARDALRFLAQRTARAEESLITNFVISAWAEQTERTLLSTRPEDPEPEELLEIAARVHETAETIRTLNAKRSWHADCPSAEVFPDEEKQRVKITKNICCQTVNRRSFNQTKRAFQNLPGTLEMYAQSLWYKAQSAQGFRRLKKKRGKLQHQMESALLEHVRELTGHKYRERVASTFRVVNLKAGVPAVEAESLRKREQRKRAQA